MKSASSSAAPLLFLTTILLAGCGGSSSARRASDNEAGAAGMVEPTSGTGGSTTTGGGSGETGGSTTGGSSGSTGGQAGEPATGGDGGTGNVGGNCEPWDETNLTILISGWDPNSGDPMPETCGYVADPCTGMQVDLGTCGDYQECGAGEAVAVGSEAEYADPIPNICGNSCVEDRTSSEFWTCHNLGYHYALLCTPEHYGEVTLPPDCDDAGASWQGIVWCCR